MTQQIVQVQIFLPESFAMQPTDRIQRFGQNSGLLIGQRRQRLDLGPGITEALGTLEKFEQQPATLAVLQPIGQ